MKNLDKYRGCLIGGAVGDALGYAVEFLRWRDIQKRYGANGIQAYDLDVEEGGAIISDDTQMTLYTAVGMMVADVQGKREQMVDYIYRAYLDWYYCQRNPMSMPPHNISWISELFEMHERRAPGNTCMSALCSGEKGTLENPINNSKGCGGVMRVAPIGLYFDYQDGTASRIGAEAAALTHGHELGYIPAAALAYLISLVLRDEHITLRNAVLMMRRSWQIDSLFKTDEYRQSFNRLIDAALGLSLTAEDDVAAIGQLGEGWVGDEALAIALYCALKYENDFEKAIIASVNHSGDSDSTGAITGNILGAYLGLERIPKRFLEHLELRNIILEVADDLCRVQDNAYTVDSDPMMDEKYMNHLS